MQIKLKRKYYMPQVVSFPLKKYPDKLSSTYSAVEKCVCPTSLLIYLFTFSAYLSYLHVSDNKTKFNTRQR